MGTCKYTIEIDHGQGINYFREDFYKTLKPESFVGVRTLLGGPAPATMKICS